ncbi:unnamed protein product [Angiostrongylus costaricensis]|uniref:Transforming growth factor beta regulator 1 n=1 Tax=Angiostrongylus costaricensis TaxID=334426 RepID=A0A0R3PAX3_ANGCS|nr:unnamed protein product [Angiostrongylus costaricensis]
MTRIADDVCPLKVVLSWQKANCGHALILQENDTGDILWDAFEVPELDNFLRILRMEEQQYQWQIRQRYYQYSIFQVCEIDVAFHMKPVLVPRCHGFPSLRDPRWYHIDLELRRRGYSNWEYVDEPPTELAPPVPTGEKNEYGTGGSMVVSDVFNTIGQEQLSPEELYNSVDGDINDPTYVNLNFLKSQHMQQSTML